MVNIEQLLELADNFKAKKNIGMAIQMYHQILEIKPDLAIAHASIAQLLAAQGDLRGEYECLKNFSHCPLTMIDMKILPVVEQRLAELDKQFNVPVVPIQK